MTRPALLDNITHRHLRLHTGRSAALGDARNSALALPAEFRLLQAHYPIVFQLVDGDGGFQPIALFGLEDGQNLFLTDQGWDATAVPMAVQRDPFLIGRAPDDTLQLHIDLDSPRIVRPDEGEVGTALFMPHGGFSEYLDHMVKLMESLHAHAQQLPAFTGALKQHQLLEPMVLDLETRSGEHSRLTGLFTINEERLAALPGVALEDLARQGYLLPCYMQIASLAQLPVLAERAARR
ncbi:SapC family protein [Ideonella sp. 4Y11]|uniref:SapC family protein n=1 Tax=Ideonella aquatica TaxID=2824119 RepID=A0A941BIJ4_9BURK|nr:SapC family protein [Ideonella aquatica]MBQ0957898.1 SapC family protein [Ideonella aquatica]